MEKPIYFCDICGKQFEPPPATDGQHLIGDCGVWFDYGQRGIPHVCGVCQDKTTIAQARELLKSRGQVTRER